MALPMPAFLQLGKVLLSETLAEVLLRSLALLRHSFLPLVLPSPSPGPRIPERKELFVSKGVPCAVRPSDPHPEMSCLMDQRGASPSFYLLLTL